MWIDINLLRVRDKPSFLELLLPYGTVTTALTVIFEYQWQKGLSSVFGSFYFFRQVLSETDQFGEKR